MTYSWLIISFVIAIVASYALRKKAANRPSLPPGPKGLPLLGNLNDLPQPGVLEAHHWLKHKELYGPISSVTVMGQTITIVNDSRLAFELLEKRSAIHSSRPKQVFAGELVGWENSLGLSPYNNRFRTYRKNMSRIIGNKSLAARYNELQEAEVGHFLLHTLENPDKLADNIRKEAGAIILKIAYGYTAEQHKEDPLVEIVGDAMEKFAQAAVPGAFMVDIMPFLKYLPDWFPGTGWKKTARQWGKELVAAADRPYAFTKEQMAHGKNISFLSQLLEKSDVDPEEKFTNKWSAMSLYAAGADTTVSSMLCFFLAMSICPEAQKKAQEEVDQVIGTDRLPTVADRENLPYIEATVKEVLRWHPVAPMGLPHTSTEDDLCEGYLIPKGGMIFANVWHFTHDPNVYHDPMTFKPERFLTTDSGEPEPDPAQFVFGFGRRICPGRVLADNTLFLSIAQSLAVFNITKPQDKAGKEVDTTVAFEPGVISHPAPYKCTIRPRSGQHEALIRSIEQTYPWLESDAPALESIKQR